MPRDHRILLQLADPDADPPQGPPLPAATLGRILGMAETHGVLPTVVSRLPPAQAAALPADLRERLRGQATTTLLLRQVAAKVLPALHAAGIPCCVVKGPLFADRLYRAPAWRPFTDLDLLLAAADMERAGAELTTLGFRAESFALRHTDGYAETKWVADFGLEVLVELHWDMIGSPTLRRGRSLDLALLGGPEAAATPGALLLIAAIHAALGDSFTRLQPMIDLLAVVRGKAGTLDHDWLRARIAEGHLERPVALALALAAEAFDEPACIAVSRALRLPQPPARVAWLLSPAILAAGRHGGGPLASLRRQLLRQWMKEPAGA